MIYTVYYWIVRDGKQRGYNFLVENDVMRMRTHQIVSKMNAFLLLAC